MKPLFSTVIVAVLLLGAVSTPQAAPNVSATVGDMYYRIGGGKVLPPPGAGTTSLSLRSRFTGGFGMTCGQFNFHENIEQIVNEWKSKVRKIPGQLKQAFSAWVASLPSYLMMKYNPSLYNTLTKTLDESAALFNMSYKSCQQVEQELRNDPDANPYQGFLQASVMDRWSTGQQNQEVIADVEEETQKAPAKPIRWIGGHERGTVNDPIQINRDLVVAGYNIMIGRIADVSASGPPGNTYSDEPIVKIWRSPQDAGEWIQEVIGDKLLVLSNTATPDESIPGLGLRPKVEAMETDMREALADAYERNDYTALNRYPSTLRFSGSLIDGLRSLPWGEASVMMDRLASEMAVKEIQERTFLIRQMLDTGLEAPDVSESTGGAIADQYVRNTTQPEIKTRLGEILDDLDLKQRTLNRTTIAILNRAEQVRSSGSDKMPGVTRGDEGYLNH